MHLYVATRGIKNEVDQFITELQGKYLPMKWRDNKEQPFREIQFQVGVRPIQLWEICYPKEHHDVMCTTILGKENQLYGNDGSKTGPHKWINKFIWIFRKLLHLDPVGEYKTDKIYPISKQHMNVIGLGTKKDYIMENDCEGL